MADRNAEMPAQSLEAELIRITRGLYSKGGYEYAKSVLADSLVLLAELRHADAGGRDDGDESSARTGRDH